MKSTYGKYNGHLDKTNFLSRQSVEYELVTLYLNNPDMEIVKESDLFDRYVQEIYDFMYPIDDNPSETAEGIRRNICTRKACKNIIKKAEKGRMQLIIHVPLTTYIDLEETHGKRKVSAVVSAAAQEAL